MSGLAGKIVLAGLWLLLLGGLTLIYVVGQRVDREHTAAREREARLQAQLATVRAERESKEAYLRQFLDDRAFVERVVRERLGYVGPGEVIIRFEAPGS